jgi:CheY-like chemotaxis protein
MGAWKVVRRCLEPFRFAAQAKGLGWEFQSEGPFVPVWGDAERWQQVAGNLVGNALKFTDTGRVSVHLKAKAPQDDCQEVILTVADTGIGIAPDRISDLFQPFTQIHRDRHFHSEGCGLGLAICKHMAMLMNGDIAVASEVNRGSAFTFRASLAVAGEPEDSETEKADLPGESAVRTTAAAFPGRILLVEDVPVNLLVASRLLQSLGFEVDTASNGRQGVEAFERGGHELIFMDLQMPEMDGLQAAREIQRLALSKPEAPKPRIIALTANTLDETRNACLAAGMCGFVEKPLSKARLSEAVARAFTV